VQQIGLKREQSLVRDMTSWHTGLFSSLERWTSRDQRQQVGSLESFWHVVPGHCYHC
jgi:hypothetical protein